jgi:hypothetical protein
VQEQRQQQHQQQQSQAKLTWRLLSRELGAMSQDAAELRLEDLEIKLSLITKLKGAGIESIFDLAISIPHQLIEHGGIPTGTDEQAALELVMNARKALIDSGLLAKDFSTAEQILERRKIC